MPRFKIKQRALTSGAFCAPCVGAEFQEKTAALTRSQFGPSGLAVVAPPVPVAPPAADLTVARWSGVIAVEGQMTGDGRLIELGALTWDELPIPLRWDVEDDGGHSGAVVVGLIETVERRGGDIFATGFVDLVSDNGYEAATMMGTADRPGLLKGVSIDPDTVDFEIRVKAELLNAGAADIVEDVGDDVEIEVTEDPAALPAPDADGYITVGALANDDEIMVMTSARLRAATIVDVPAFSGAQIFLDAPLGARPNFAQLTAAGRDFDTNPFISALRASAAKLSSPPAAWFRNPGLSGPTALTITDDGRVFGHCALSDSCHLGYDTCVKPPMSQTDYAWFKTGILVADDGSEHAVGQITMNTGHASTASGPAATLAHYDNTGLAVADVTAGEDAYGIWVAGAVRPHVTEDQKRTLRASPLSGDWRRVGGNLELVALLAVTVPGFVVPRGMVASGHMDSLQLPSPTQDALVAAGFAPSKPDVVAVDESMEFTAEDMRELRVLLASNRREQAERAEAAAEMARGMRAEELAREMGI